jgi:hypothetical protein
MAVEEVDISNTKLLQTILTGLLNIGRVRSNRHTIRLIAEFGREEDIMSLATSLESFAE